MADSASTLLHKGPCEECGSSDANGFYDDGHTFCHKCETYGRHDGEEGDRPRKEKLASDLIRGNIEAIPKRRLDERVCEKFNYQVGEFNGRKCHIAPYYDDTGKVVAAFEKAGIDTSGAALPTKREPEWRVSRKKGRR